MNGIDESLCLMAGRLSSTQIQLGLITGLGEWALLLVSCHLVMHRVSIGPDLSLEPLSEKGAAQGTVAR